MQRPLPADATAAQRCHALRAPKGLNAHHEGDGAQLQEQSRQCDAKLFHAQQLLKDFPFLQELQPEVQAKLPGIVHYTSESRGTVVFWQGDAPGNCYIILSGEVEVWKAKGEDEEEGEEDGDEESAQCPGLPALPSPRSCKTGSTRSTDGASASEASHDVRRSSFSSTCTAASECSAASASGGVRRRSFSTPQKLPAAAPPACMLRRHNLCSIVLQTACGSEQVHSPCHSGLGTKVAALGPGAMFGELALLQGQPRSATILCSEDCEFAIIKRVDFDAVLKREMTQLREERLAFLRRHLPGMRDLPPHKVDKVFYHFRKVTVPKGHAFFKQGATAKKGVFLLSKGTVELRCKEAPESSLPGGTRQLGTLMAGSLFGSSAASLPEPFSAVATSPCEVLCARGRSLKHLPLTITHSVRKYLAQTMLWRLDKCDPALDVQSGGSSLPSTRCSTPGSTTPNRLVRRRVGSTSAASLPGSPSLSGARSPSLGSISWASASGAGTPSRGGVRLPDGLPAGSRPGTPSRPRPIDLCAVGRLGAEGDSFRSRAVEPTTPPGGPGNSCLDRARRQAPGQRPAPEAGPARSGSMPALRRAAREAPRMAATRFRTL